MKYIDLRLQVLTLESGKMPYDSNNYKSAGLYLVKLDIGTDLVYFDGTCPIGMHIPIDLYIDEAIREYRNQEELKSAENKSKEKVSRDKHQEIMSALSKIHGLLLEVPTEVPEQGTNISIKDITELLAINQKPELIKDTRR